MEAFSFFFEKKVLFQMESPSLKTTCSNSSFLSLPEPLMLERDGCAAYTSNTRDQIVN